MGLLLVVVQLPVASRCEMQLLLELHLDVFLLVLARRDGRVLRPAAGAAATPAGAAARVAARVATVTATAATATAAAITPATTARSPTRTARPAVWQPALGRRKVRAQHDRTRRHLEATSPFKQRVLLRDLRLVWWASGAGTRCHPLDTGRVLSRLRQPRLRFLPIAAHRCQQLRPWRQPPVRARRRDPHLSLHDELRHAVRLHAVHERAYHGLFCVATDTPATLVASVSAEQGTHATATVTHPAALAPTGRSLPTTTSLVVDHHRSAPTALALAAAAQSSTRPTALAAAAIAATASAATTRTALGAPMRHILRHGRALRPRPIGARLVHPAAASGGQLRHLQLR